MYLQATPVHQSACTSVHRSACKEMEDRMARNKRDRGEIRRKTALRKDRATGNAPSNSSPQIGYGEAPESPASSELDSSEHQDSPSSSDSDSSEQVFENRGLFEFSKTKEKHVKKYNARETIYDIKLTEQLMGQYWNDALGQIFEIIDKCIKEATEGLHPQDRIRIYVEQSHFETPIVIHMRPIESLKTQHVLAEIERILQSKMELKLDSSFRLQIATMQLPRGGGRTKLIEENVKNKRSVIIIKNEDNLCMARSILVSKSYFDVVNCPENASQAERLALVEFREKIKSSKHFQTAQAEKLQTRAGLPVDRVCSFDDIKNFERYLNVQIVIVNEEDNYACQTYGYPFEKKIYILYRKNNHFDAITKIHSFLSNSYFCEKCLCGHNDKKKHVCYRSSCTLCFSISCKFVEAHECDDCHRVCHSRACYDAHRKKGYDVTKRKETPSTCESVYKCLLCDGIFKQSEVPKAEHDCESTYCKNCKCQVVTKDHQCFQLAKEPNAVSSKYIFFDFECRQETGTHIVNYAVAQKTCEKCIDRILNEDNLMCSSCGIREKHFTSADDFCKWLFTKDHMGYTLVAHNCKAYDGYFILKYLLEHKIKPEIIFRGGKILFVKVNAFNIRIIDSLNFIPSALSKLPETFGLKELKKGYFPHYFNTEENQDYEGEIPDPKFYGVDQMSEKDRNDFLIWHQQKKDSGYIFNFKCEMAEYCKSDVDILRRCCLEFRSLMINLTKKRNPRPSKNKNKPSYVAVDPFQYITIASVCMAVYKYKFMPEDTIALLPFTGLSSRDRYSKISIIWLEWLMHKAAQAKKPMIIRHGQNAKEESLGLYKIDGYCEKKKIIFEMYGCFWHGCILCYPNQENINPKTNTSFGDLRKRVTEREEKLKATYNVEIQSIWECEFRKEMRENEELKAFSKSQDIQERLDPRDAFLGGRTNAIKLKESCQENEEIHYVDFCSLYPWVQKYCEFPVGYPEILTENFKDVSEYFGIIKCKVLPPRGLFHPVLGMKCNETLRFPLCRTCCENDFQGTCEHDSDKRAFIGTWTTLEVNKAIEKGYQVLKIYEVYHFHESAKYCPETGEGGMFTGYVNTFLKLKAEASGYPAWVKTEADKQEYVRLYKEREGIELDPANIKYNPGLRALAKLMMNSFWGRFGMRGDYSQTAIIFEPSQLWQKLTDDSIIPTDCHLFDEDCLVLEYNFKREYTAPTKDANIFIAVFTTSHARLKLYSELERLQDRVLYLDTDSIIYKHDTTSSDYVPSTGDFLGDLTSEVSCKDVKCKNKENCNQKHFIESFVAAGPKNYAFRTDNGFSCCKIRGFTLNYENSQHLNFDVLHEMISNYPQKKDTVIIRNPSKICRNKKTLTIYNREEIKKYKICYLKRVLLEDFSTLPYGY